MRILMAASEAYPFFKTGGTRRCDFLAQSSAERTRSRGLAVRTLLSQAVRRESGSTTAVGTKRTDGRDSDVVKIGQGRTSLDPTATIRRDSP